ncbi:MAG TPA: SRPBCC domain-containing protein [Gemmatimonadaceae bacterium]|nr:SRPBCC domain-containing protein [Gemmatimonadaceae bacterium]
MASTAQKPSTHRLQVRRTFSAPPERLFRAWTTAAELKKWHAPRDLGVSLAEVDLKVGGRYRIHMRQPDGAEHRVSGIYRVIDPPRKLAYTWQWDGDAEETLVTLEFLPKGTGTELVLTHEGFATDEKRTSHEHGWTSILERLSTAKL